MVTPPQPTMFHPRTRGTVNNPPEPRNNRTMRRFITLATIALLGCSSEPEPNAAPVGADSAGSHLPTLEESISSTGEEDADACPWDGRCASLAEDDACSSTWSLPCGDGRRCVDPQEHSGIHCPHLDGTSSSTSGDIASMDGATEEPSPCAWSGACADLVEIDACGGWALACGDGWRCVDTEMEAGILCVPDESSSSATDTTDTDTDTDMDASSTGGEGMTT